jgi:hypothetical protein
MSPAPLAQQNANITEEAKKVLAALQGTWKLAIREEVGKEGTDMQPHGWRLDCGERRPSQ